MGLTCNYNPNLVGWGSLSTNLSGLTPPHVVGRHHFAAFDELAVRSARQIPVSTFVFTMAAGAILPALALSF
jgi:hypothetical protein